MECVGRCQKSVGKKSIAIWAPIRGADLTGRLSAEALTGVIIERCLALLMAGSGFLAWAIAVDEIAVRRAKVDAMVRRVFRGVGL